MSADVSIGDYSYNYTHNTARLWYDHIPDMGKGGGLRELEGLTGKQAVLVLHECFERIQSTRLNLWQQDAVGEPIFEARYNAKNGWGSLVGALIFLAQIMAACALCPKHKVRVSL
jgi:hypothetical protein